VVERIAIFAALPWEERAARRSVAGVKRVHSAAWAATWAGHALGRDVWLVRTGIGEERARAAAEAVSHAQRFDAFLSIGCAAGLAPELAPGDVVVADAVFTSDGAQRFGTELELRESLTEAARRGGVRVTVGSYACCAAVLASREDKRRAAAAHGAVLAEMEGAAIARVALRAGIPFGAVRAVLDPIDVELRHATGIVDPSTGRVRPLELIGKLASSAGAWPELLAMQRMMRAARSSLERVFAALLVDDPLSHAHDEKRASEGG
jgi:nucleoside phosphorylase